jgi:hypothetical protein
MDNEHNSSYDKSTQYTTAGAWRWRLALVLRMLSRLCDVVV